MQTDSLTLKFPGKARVASAGVLSTLPFLAVGAGVLYLYLPVLANLVYQWRTDESYSHGFLIPIVSAYLVWERRHRIRRCPHRAFPWGYGVLLLGLALFLLGRAATFGYPTRLSFLIVLVGLVLFVAGPAVVRTLSFPLAYLLFMVPLPAILLNTIAFPLQLLAARTATVTLDLLNVPVLQEGNIIDLPTTRLEVTEACSGLRSLVSLLALAVIYAYMIRRTWRDRLLLTLSAIPIAVVANAARVTLTGLLAQLYGPQAARGFYHVFSGWIVFLVAFGLLITEGRILSALRPSEGRA